MAAKKDKPTIKPLTEDQLKAVVQKLERLDLRYKELDAIYDALTAEVMATLQPRDVRQWGTLRCTIVQAMQRGVKWKDETSRLARLLYPTKPEFRAYLQRLVRRYPKKPVKASVKVSRLKETAA